MTEYTFHLPCYTTTGKRKGLNLNWYRNAHYQALAKAKREFTPVSIDGQYLKAQKIEIHYTFVQADKRRTDAMNWISIVDKFFCDWLVTNGCIPDDSTKYVSKGEWDCELHLDEDEHYIYAKVVKIC
jgi:hypothetical protein